MASFVIKYNSVFSAWKDVTSGNFDSFVLPGHHFYLLEPSNTSFIKKYITKSLEISALASWQIPPLLGLKTVPLIMWYSSSVFQSSLGVCFRDWKMINLLLSGWCVIYKCISPQSIYISGGCKMNGSRILSGGSFFFVLESHLGLICGRFVNEVPAWSMIRFFLSVILTVKITDRGSAWNEMTVSLTHWGPKPDLIFWNIGLPQSMRKC